MYVKEVRYGTEGNGLHWVFVNHDRKHLFRPSSWHTMLSDYNATHPQQKINIGRTAEDYIYYFDKRNLSKETFPLPKKLRDLDSYKYIERLKPCVYYVSNEENELHININNKGFVNDETQISKQLSSPKRKAQSANEPPTKQPRINQVLCSQFLLDSYH